MKVATKVTTERAGIEGMKPGDVLPVVVRTPSGQTRQAEIRLAPREGLARSVDDLALALQVMAEGNEAGPEYPITPYMLNRV